MKIAVHLETGKPDKTAVTIDGVDVTRSILATGFVIDPGTDKGMCEPTVTMTFAPDVLELDIDGELLAALTEGH